MFDTLTAVKRERDVRYPHCPHVFHRNGNRGNNFRAAWASACRAVGLEGRLFHDFRPTAVRNMVRAGVPERVAQQISGHKTRSIFDRYHIVSDSDLREAAKRHSAYVTNETVTKTVTVGDIDRFFASITSELNH